MDFCHCEGSEPWGPVVQTNTHPFMISHKGKDLIVGAHIPAETTTKIKTIKIVKNHKVQQYEQLFVYH